MRLKVGSCDGPDDIDAYAIVTISEKEKQGGKDFEGFELFQPVGNKDGQFIIRSLQTNMFIRVSEDKYPRADVVHPFDASKFVLIPRYLLQSYNPNIYIKYQSSPNQGILNFDLT